MTSWGGTAHAGEHRACLLLLKFRGHSYGRKIVNASIMQTTVDFSSRRVVEDILVAPCSTSNVPEDVIRTVAAFAASVNGVANEMLLTASIATNSDIMDSANALDVIVKYFAERIATMLDLFSSTGDLGIIGLQLEQLLLASKIDSVRHNVAAAIASLAPRSVPPVTQDDVSFTVDVTGNVCEATKALLGSTLGSNRWNKESMTSVVGWGLSDVDPEDARTVIQQENAATSHANGAGCCGAGWRDSERGCVDGVAAADVSLDRRIERSGGDAGERGGVR